MRGHKIHFYGEIWKIIPKLSLFPLLIWIADLCFPVCFPSQLDKEHPFELGSTLKGKNVVLLEKSQSFNS